MASLLDQLKQLRKDLILLIERDPEQEVTGQALPLIDAVISEARKALPLESSLSAQVVEVVSVETIAQGEGLRAADALVIVGQLIAVLSDEPEKQRLAADRELFGVFRALLPSTSVAIVFLRDHDLGAPFRWEQVDALDTFVQDWDNAEHRFHDQAIERSRAELLDLTRSFVTCLALESIPGPGGRQAVVAAEYRDTFRLLGREDDIRRVDTLNGMATAIYDSHQRLVEVARERLLL